ncbi:MAG: sensor domain-containing diguanylate cyclase [Deltaproteobacteria bacterium]|nr:sensor domain-containing diguanylate cyclase [Deltaproteobacteria bacterium]
MNQGESLESALEDIAEAAAKVAQVETASVLLFDQSGEALLCRAAHGFTDDEVQKIGFRRGEGIAGWVAEKGESARVGDAPVDPRFKDLGLGRAQRGMVCVPLEAAGRVIGVITASSQDAEAFTAEHESMMEFLASSVVRDLENARLYRLAVTDALTLAYNRQYLSERFPAEMDRALRYDQPLSLIMLDIDHFKQVNDTHGHPVGDEVLRAVVRITSDLVREIDVVVRYGGEEFILLLPNTDREGGWRVADRIRQRVAETPIETERGALRLTVSAGVAQASGAGDDAAALIRRADKALYEAKEGGRNQVVVAR